MLGIFLKKFNERNKHATNFVIELCLGISGNMTKLVQNATEILMEFGRKIKT